MRTFLLGALLTQHAGCPAHLSRIHETLCALPEVDRFRLGVLAKHKGVAHLLTYRQTEYLNHLLGKALSEEVPDGLATALLQDLVDGLATLNALRKRLVDGWLHDATAAGLDDDGIAALFQSALRDFREGRKSRAASPRDGRASGRSAGGVA